MDNDSIMAFVMSHLPEQWDKTVKYTQSWILVPLSKHSIYFQIVKSYFNGAQISSIQRVQNPFQFGRYILRREMIQTTYEVCKQDFVTILLQGCI